jgi:hypothetical protein
MGHDNDKDLLTDESRGSAQRLDKLSHKLIEETCVCPWFATLNVMLKFMSQ